MQNLINLILQYQTFLIMAGMMISLLYSVKFTNKVLIITESIGYFKTIMNLIPEELTGRGEDGAAADAFMKWSKGAGLPFIDYESMNESPKIVIGLCYARVAKYAFFNFMFSSIFFLGLAKLILDNV